MSAEVISNEKNKRQYAGKINPKDFKYSSKDVEISYFIWLIQNTAYHNSVRRDNNYNRKNFISDFKNFLSAKKVYDDMERKITNYVLKLCRKAVTKLLKKFEKENKITRLNLIEKYKNYLFSFMKKNISNFNDFFIVSFFEYDGINDEDYQNFEMFIKHIVDNFTEFDKRVDGLLIVLTIAVDPMKIYKKESLQSKKDWKLNNFVSFQKQGFNLIDLQLCGFFLTVVQGITDPIKYEKKQIYTFYIYIIKLIPLRNRVKHDISMNYIIFQNFKDHVISVKGKFNEIFAEEVVEGYIKILESENPEDYLNNDFGEFLKFTLPKNDDCLGLDLLPMFGKPDSINVKEFFEIMVEYKYLSNEKNVLLNMLSYYSQLKYRYMSGVLQANKIKCIKSSDMTSSTENEITSSTVKTIQNINSRKRTRKPYLLYMIKTVRMFHKVSFKQIESWKTITFS